jgi:hypothetical protein
MRSSVAIAALAAALAWAGSAAAQNKNVKIGALSDQSSL